MDRWHAFDGFKGLNFAALGLKIMSRGARAYHALILGETPSTCKTTGSKHYNRLPRAGSLVRRSSCSA